MENTTNNEKPQAPEKSTHEHPEFIPHLFASVWWASGWILFFILILVLFWMSGITRKMAADKEKALAEAAGTILEESVNVVVARLKAVPYDESIVLPGTVRPYREFNLSSQVSGLIIHRNIQAGDFVHAGDILYQIDPLDWKINVANANAALKLAKSELDRAKRMIAGEAASQATLDRAQAEYDRASAAAKTARAMLERCTITAPMDGYVENTYAEEGELANSGTRMARILDMSRVKVYVGIPESDITDITMNSIVRLSVPTAGRTGITGKIIRIAQAAEERIRVFPLEIELDNQTGFFKSGMVVSAEIVKHSYQKAFIAPLSSIVTVGEKRYVFVMKNGKAHRISIETGSIAGNFIHITSGINDSVILLLKGQHQVSDGSKINVTADISDQFQESLTQLVHSASSTVSTKGAESEGNE